MGSLFATKGLSGELHKAIAAVDKVMADFKKVVDWHKSTHPSMETIKQQVAQARKTANATIAEASIIQIIKDTKVASEHKLDHLQQQLDFMPERDLSVDDLWSTVYDKLAKTSRWLRDDFLRVWLLLVFGSQVYKRVVLLVALLRHPTTVPTEAATEG